MMIETARSSYENLDDETELNLLEGVWDKKKIQLALRTATDEGEMGKTDNFTDRTEAVCSMEREITLNLLT